MEVGQKITLSTHVRDIYMNKIGGLKVEVLEIFEHTAEVKICATGEITTINKPINLNNI